MRPLKKMNLVARSFVRLRYSKTPKPKKLIKKYCLKGVRKLKHSKGFGVHSPFAFDLITNVIEEKAMYYSYQQIETIRNNYLRKRLPSVELSGRKEIPFKRAALLFRLANRFHPSSILEIGTSWGVSTLYLAKACPQASCICIESDEVVTSLAKGVIKEALASNVSFASKDTPIELLELINQTAPIGFILVHPYASLRFYQELLSRLSDSLDKQAVIIIEDIHATSEAYAYWKQFISNPKVRVTMDLYDFGLAFYDPKLNKQDYIVAF